MGRIGVSVASRTSKVQWMKPEPPRILGRGGENKVTASSHVTTLREEREEIGGDGNRQKLRPRHYDREADKSRPRRGPGLAGNDDAAPLVACIEIEASAGRCSKQKSSPVLPRLGAACVQ